MRNITSILTKQLLGAAIAAAALITPAIASAQDVPMYASAGDQIQGRVAAINGTWNITVADDNGYSDSVELHQGTIINPTGLTLEPGMSVTIDGYADGPNFDAMEIDTPYHYAGPPPVAVYYGPGSWYPGYAYGWGPSFSLFFDTGTRRYEQRAFYYGGQERRPMAPPSGWQNRPHGFVGSVSLNVNVQSHNYAQPQAQRQNFGSPQQQPRNFAPAQQQQRSFAAPAAQQPRTFAPQQQQHNFAPAQQQQRSFAAPAAQQPRAYAAPAARSAAPAARSTGTAAHGDWNAERQHR
jgi:hypothetical protein